MQMDERDVVLEGMANVRDLGGFRTRTGHLTQRNVFLRGDAPYRISDAARQQLMDAGLRTVIDMRYTHEVVRRPNRFAGVPVVDFRHIPLYVETSYMGMIRQFRDLGGWYCTILDQGSVPIRTIIDVLAAAEGTCLIHCYIGKDRTGIMSALLLDLVGVSTEDIIADYVRSHHKLQAIHAELQSVRPFFVSKSQFENIIAAKHEYISTMLSHIAHTYTNAEGYLLSIGVTPAEIVKLRQKLLAPALT